LYVYWLFCEMTDKIVTLHILGLGLEADGLFDINDNNWPLPMAMTSVLQMLLFVKIVSIDTSK